MIRPSANTKPSCRAPSLPTSRECLRGARVSRRRIARCFLRVGVLPIWISTFSDPAEAATPDWVTVVNTEAHWLWFAFKNAAVMPARAHWIENHGRHGSPWNGRNACIGLEDGCMYFAAGLAESAGANVVNRRGIPTARELDGRQPFEVLYVQGAIPVPREFGRVAAVRFEPANVVFVDEAGRTVVTPLRTAFVFDGQMQDV